MTSCVSWSASEWWGIGCTSQKRRTPLPDLDEEISLKDFKTSFDAAETSFVQMRVGDIITSLRNSCQFFMHFFLGEELIYEVPPFHLKTWSYLTATTLHKIAIALPRGHAKTTLAKLAAVWYLLFTPIRFIVYTSNTHSIAAESCKAIMDYIRSDNFVAVFGRVEFDVEQDQRGFYKFTLNHIDETGQARSKYCILRALGAGQQVRGTNIDNIRPELAIVDDLEDEENTATVVLLRKLIRWLFGPFLKALSRKNKKVIYIGNMLSNKSPLYHFCEQADDWYSLRYGCLLADGQPLWPDMWSLEAIRADFVEYQKLNLSALWFAEMMNLPIAEGNLLIQAEDIFYAPPINPGEQSMAFLTIDPAISKKTWADDRAIVVHAYNKRGFWQIADQVVGKFSPDDMFFIVVDLCLKWHTRCVGIEQAGFQMALKYLFEVMMTVNQQHFEIYEIPHKNQSKVERLAMWCSLLRKHLWALNEGDYAVTEQLLTFDPTKENNIDDLIDACSMGVTMTSLYMGEIEGSYLVIEAPKIQTSVEMCGI